MKLPNEVIFVKFEVEARLVEAEENVVDAEEEPLQHEQARGHHTLRRQSEHSAHAATRIKGMWRCTIETIET